MKKMIKIAFKQYCMIADMVFIQLEIGDIV